MAEIKIEKKKPIWPWIILVLVILAILYFLVFANDDEEVDELDEVGTEQVEETALQEDAETTTWDDETETEWDTGEGVSGYLTYIGDDEKMGLDHEYTNNALIYLLNAVQAKADEMEYDISADMQSVRQAAQAITTDPLSLTHADKIKFAGTRLAMILANMQQEEFPDLSRDVIEVKTAAENINPAIPTLDQRDQVKKFFDEAGDVLEKMS